MRSYSKLHKLLFQLGQAFLAVIIISSFHLKRVVHPPLQLNGSISDDPLVPTPDDLGCLFLA